MICTKCAEQFDGSYTRNYRDLCFKCWTWSRVTIPIGARVRVKEEGRFGFGATGTVIRHNTLFNGEAHTLACEVEFDTPIPKGLPDEWGRCYEPPGGIKTNPYRCESLEVI